MYLQRGFKRTINAIRQHYALTLLLLAIQIILFIAMFYTALNFLPGMIDTVQAIAPAIQMINLDPSAVQQGNPPVQDPVTLYKNIQQLIHDVIWLIVSLGVEFVFLGMILWILSMNVIAHQHLSWKQRFITSGIHGIQYLSITFLFIVLLVGITWYWLKGIMGENDPNQILILLRNLVIAKGVLYFLLMLGYGSLNKSWGSFVRAWWISIKHFYKALPVLIIDLALIGSSGYLIYWAVSSAQSETLIFLLTFIPLIMMVITRLFWIACIGEIGILRTIKEQ